MAAKLDFVFLLFRICEVHIRAPRARYATQASACWGETYLRAFQI